MNILMIGGTQFVGRAIAQAALDNGHDLTLFHRGRTNPDLFPQATHIYGDRMTDIANLGDRTWDVVIDTCGYVPRAVRIAADYLKDRVQRYVFISTISVYADDTTSGRDESAELATLDDPTTEDVTGATYGGLKVLCEETAEAILPGRVLVIRPGLIVGPHDPTNRFTYWVTRVAQGGDVLAPGDPDAPTQFIDVRDLAAWTIHMTATQQTGIYNATGPAQALTIGTVLEACRTASTPAAQLVWVANDFLLAHDVAPFSDLPLWLPHASGQALMQLSIDRALAAGLTLRPLATTIADTRAWVNRLDDAPGRDRAGLSAERERELLEAWYNQG